MYHSNALLNFLQACVTRANEASEKFHEHFKFKKCAEFQNAGFKHGKWYGITWFELPINDYDKNPKPVISINNLDTTAVDKVFSSYLD